MGVNVRVTLMTGLCLNTYPSLQMSRKYPPTWKLPLRLLTTKTGFPLVVVVSVYSV